MCPLVAAIVSGHKPSYATVLQRPPSLPKLPSPASSDALAAKDQVLGRPLVKLPLSQLTLGRTTAPWQGSAWVTKACSVEGDVLRVEYPRGSGNFRGGGPRGGCSFKARPHCVPATDLTFSYRVRFADSFQWSKGGKLPGIFVGSGEASGGHHSSNGASMRVMWQEGGQLIGYVYPPSGVKQPAAYERAADGSKTGHGDGLFKDAGLYVTKGDWNDIVVRVKLNSFDNDGKPNPDGVATLSVNGTPASLTGIVWRRKPSVKITHVNVVTFYGGKWKSPKSTYAEFTDFACVA